jgi:hypothetical protein
LANPVVLSDDPTTVPLGRPADIAVNESWIAGALAYGRG